MNHVWTVTLRHLPAPRCCRPQVFAFGSQSNAGFAPEIFRAARSLGKAASTTERRRHLSISQQTPSRHEFRRSFSQNAIRSAKQPKPGPPRRPAVPRPTDHTHARKTENTRRPGPSEIHGNIRDIENSLLTLPGQPFAVGQLRRIFSEDINPRIGNLIISTIQERRETGQLADLGVQSSTTTTWPDRQGKRALQWLREQHPMDEEVAVAAWAEKEAERLAAEMYVKRGQQFGLYKKDKKGGSDEGEEIPEQDPYGESGLDKIRKENEARFLAKQQLRQQIEAQQAQSRNDPVENQGGRFLPKSQRPAERPKGLDKYEDKAKRDLFVKQSYATKHTEPPKMSAMERMGPSTAVVLLTIAACFAFASLYTPAPREARLFPNVPPSVVTMMGLMTINWFIFLAWHTCKTPSIRRFFNKYFVSTPGYPFAMSMVGNIFNHTELPHLLFNTFWLLPLGISLHEYIGRGNFIALYVATGAFGTWLSMAIHVGQGLLITASTGASGAIYGIVGCLCRVLPDNSIPLFIPYTDWGFYLWSTPVLLVIAASQILGLRNMRGRMDHGAHLGGLIAGVVGGELFKLQARKHSKEAEQTKQDQGAFDGEASETEDTATKSEAHTQRPKPPVSNQ